MPLLGSMIGGEQPFYPYKIDQSCRFNDNDSARLYKTYSSSPTSGLIMSVSCWYKPCNFVSQQTIWMGRHDGNNHAIFQILNSRPAIYIKGGWTDGGIDWGFQLSRILRDPTNWYHLVYVHDSPNATAADRLIIYINGVRHDRNSPLNANWGNYPQSHGPVFHVNGKQHNIGYQSQTGDYGDFYLADWHHIDGQAADPNDFAESKNGVWVPKEYTGTYGNYGEHLYFEDSANLGNDSSGNNLDYTVAGLAANDQILDIPTNNHCTLNILNKSLAGVTLTNGNLQVNVAADKGIFSTFGMTSGKWYWEINPSVVNNTCLVGLASQESPIKGGDGSPILCVAYTNAGNKVTTDGVAAGYGDNWGAAQIIGIAFDADAGNVTFYRDNVSQGVAEAGIDMSEAYFPFLSTANVGSNFDINFGQQAFTYTPPTGYKALCTKNLPEPSIMKPNLAFDILIHTGDGSDPRSFTGLNFTPDMAWTKCRNMAYHHRIYDIKRGVEKALWSNETAVEVNQDVNGYLTSFDAGGFTVDAGATNNVVHNENTKTYVNWFWKALPQYGFDIVAHNCTGDVETINHNCGGVPELIMAKSREDVQSWYVYHHHALNKTDPATDFGVLDLAQAWTDNDIIWDDTAPTETQFTIGTVALPSDYIFYLWRSIPGFSKVFSYEGNNNADGPFVYCGFRPKFVMIKNADAVQRWLIYDSIRSTYNEIDDQLYPDDPSQELTGSEEIDFLSNGFKLRSADSRTNDANTYVGIAIAETGGKYCNSR